MKQVERLIGTSDEFYIGFLGYTTEETRLIVVDDEGWEKETRRRKLDKTSGGVYLPRDMTAIVRKGNPLSLFHEYYGHGLYCERTMDGKRLVNLERELYNEEKEKFEGRRFTLKEVFEHRRQSETFKQLGKFVEENKKKYEVFAVWTEYILSRLNMTEDVFYARYEMMTEKQQSDVESLINYSECYGCGAVFEMYKFDTERQQVKGGKRKE